MPNGLSRKPHLSQIAAAIRKESRQLRDEMELKLNKLRAELERNRLNVKKKQPMPGVRLP
jgi:hypothetical protein